MSQQNIATISYNGHTGQSGDIERVCMYMCFLECVLRGSEDLLAKAGRDTF